MKTPETGKTAATMEKEANDGIKTGIIDGTRFLSSRVGDQKKLMSNSPS